MEFVVLEETKNKLVFTLQGETHTFCNLLKEELLQLDGVQIATYTIDHPLIGIPQFHLETKGLDPRKALKEALAGMKKKVQAFQKGLKEL